jgi:uncharacterized membrane protein
MLNHLKSHKAAWLITAVYGFVFCLISLVNHYNFRTFGLDLGIYTHSVYSYSHLSWHTFTLAIEGIEINTLGDHFAPFIILISPLYYLFGTYTVLIVQIATICLGGMGIYTYAQERIPKYYPVLVLLVFYNLWGIYSALAYDFHPNVVAAMLVPWLLIFYHRNHKIKTVILALIIMSCKENMAIWMAGIGLGLLVGEFFQTKQQKRFGFTLSLIGLSIGYFITVEWLVMPFFNPERVYDHLDNYSHLGDSSLEIVREIITRPRNTFYLLFESLHEDALTFKLKSQLHFMVLMSGGIALIYRPQYLIMLAPIYAQKMLSSNPSHWGIYAQYSIEFAPILAIAMTDWIQNFSFEKLKRPMIICTIATATFFNWHPTRPNTGFYKAEHYDSGLNTMAIYKALELIPDDAVVSASNVITPHLAGRDRIYLYPVLKDAEYLAILTDGRNPYPVDSLKFQQLLMDLRNDSSNQILFDDADFLIVKRKITSLGKP